MENSQEFGSNSGTQGSGGWDAMGGSPGDGIAGQLQYQQQPYPYQPAQSQPQLMYSAQAQPYANTSSYQVPYPSMPPPTPTSTVGSGSITRFATPDMTSNFQSPSSTMAQTGSYAERSARAYGMNSTGNSTVGYGGAMASTSPMPPTQMVGAGNNPSLNPDANSATSYAARSTMIRQQQQQQQPQPYTSPSPSYPPPTMSAAAASGAIPSPSTAGMSYTARAAQLSQQQQQAMAYGGQQAPTFGGQVAAPNESETFAGNTGPTSSASYYAGRSQAQFQARQQPSPQSSAAAMSSYAARSAHAQQQATLQQQTYHAYNVGPGQQQQHVQPGSYGGGSSMPVVNAVDAVPSVGSGAQQHTPYVYDNVAYNQQSAQQQKPQYISSQSSVASTMTTPTMATSSTTGAMTQTYFGKQQSEEAMQIRLLTDSTRKVQEHSYYMRQAMEQKNLPVVLDRAAHMMGELGGPIHGHHHQQQLQYSNNATQPSNTGAGPTNTGFSSKLNPKNYYELYMRALEDLPIFQEYLLSLTKPQVTPPGTIHIVENAEQAELCRIPQYTMMELYNCTQYCSRVLPRLYLQITAGSALITSGEAGAQYVLNDLAQAVRCEQNPIRGLFLRNYLLTALRSHLPDTPLQRVGEDIEGAEQQEDIGIMNPGSVKDSYEFILNNFMEMNKLWVRIQHLPGEGKNKDVRKRRERERNDLRILVGTNLVRLSQLESVTSQIYGEIILPQILEHIVVCGDPLSQAYLMDCLVQVFPDEYHIETLPILLNVCPRLRDKVNIRTILQGLMDRLANYLADEELLDESDTNEVKKNIARDSFNLFDDCVQNVYNARGPKLTSKEVIKLQTALLQFSLKCYPEQIAQVSRCLSVSVSALKQANVSYEVLDGTTASIPADQKTVIGGLDEAAILELQTLLTVPLGTLGLKVLGLDHFIELCSFLPWTHRQTVALKLLKAIENLELVPQSIKEIDEIFTVIEPLLVAENKASQTKSNVMESIAGATGYMAELSLASPDAVNDMSERFTVDRETNHLVSKLIHSFYHEDTDIMFEMLSVAKTHVCRGGAQQTLFAIIFSAVKLTRRLFEAELQYTDNDNVITSTEVTTHSPGMTDVNTDAKRNTPVVSEKEEENTSSQGVDICAVVDEAEKPLEDGDVPEKEEENLTSQGVDMSVVVNETEKPAEVDDEGHVLNESQLATEIVGNDVEVEESASSLRDTIDENMMKNKTSSISQANQINCRRVFVFIQDSISLLSRRMPEMAIKLYLEMSLAADSYVGRLTSKGLDVVDYAPVSFELISQAFSLYDETINDTKAQQRCITTIIGTLLSSKCLSKQEYETLITKTAQCSAKVTKKPEQCQLVTLCAHLFYPTEGAYVTKYQNPQRALECLQRSLKLANACTVSNPTDVQLFVDLFEQYVLFFEKQNPVITHAYLSGLAALIKEHLSSVGSLNGESRLIADAKAHFVEIVRYINQKKIDQHTADLFAPVQVENFDSQI